MSGCIVFFPTPMIKCYFLYRMKNWKHFFIVSRKKRLTFHHRVGQMLAFLRDINLKRKWLKLQHLLWKLIQAYKEDIENFLEVKNKYDPHNRFGNNLLNNLFGLEWFNKQYSNSLHIQSFGYFWNIKTMNECVMFWKLIIQFL